MPHLIIEYSENVSKEISVQDLMACAHQAALNSELFGESNIKVRTYECENALVGGTSDSFLHVTIYMLSGRDAETKKSLTNRILTSFIDMGVSVSSLTVDARDMDSEVYSKLTA